MAWDEENTTQLLERLMKLEHDKKPRNSMHEYFRDLSHIYAG